MMALADLLITLDCAPEDAREIYGDVTGPLGELDDPVESRVIGYYPTSNGVVARVVFLFAGVAPEGVDAVLEDAFGDCDAVVAYAQIGDYLSADVEDFERYVHDTSDEDLPAELRDEIEEQEEED